MSTTATEQQTTMKAIVRDRYGPPEVLRVEEIERPALAADGVLVRVRASSVNRADWYGAAGKPRIARLMMGGVLRPRERQLGTDFAGVVEAVGEDVAGFEPGDEVFGGRSGAYAEYVCARSLALKPANVSFEEAACVGVAGLTALQGLRDRGRVQPGSKVLVNGASGGVGTFAVQIAKALGAEVHAVCSARNVEQARALGADRVIDYAKEDFTRSGERYDVVFDVAGSRSWHACKRVLKPRGIVVVVGARNAPLVGPLGHVAAMRLASLGSSRKAVFFVAKFNRPDLETLGELLATGKLRPVFDRTYPLGEVADAFRAMGEGNLRSKLVVTI